MRGYISPAKEFLTTPLKTLGPAKVSGHTESSTQMAKVQTPKACTDEGLDCRSCTRNTASQLARVSKGLPPALLTQIFTQMYPNPECSPMHARFAAAYREAAEEEATPRRGAVSEGFGGVRVAVA